MALDEISNVFWQFHREALNEGKIVKDLTAKLADFQLNGASILGGGSVFQSNNVSFVGHFVNLVCSWGDTIRKKKRIYRRRVGLESVALQLCGWQGQRMCRKASRGVVIRTDNIGVSR